MKGPRVRNDERNRNRCICRHCPSYPRECPGEILYCSTGKSACDIRPAGCVCPGCPVYLENGLTGLYFCDKEPVGTTGYVMRMRRSDEDAEWYADIVSIKDAAEGGTTGIASMGSRKRMPFGFGDIHFVPAQVRRIPLNREETVRTSVVVGPASKKPLRLESPILISGMSFGATSKNVKRVIARVAKDMGIGFNSGEGGILDSDYEAGDHLIGQYATGRFGIDEEVLRRVAAVEIRFGQGAYPGKGSYLPATKMTPEVARLRGLSGKEAAYSPAHHADMTTPEQIREKVGWLKDKTGGVPIGAKIGCGDVEEDVRILVEAGVDFIAIDGFGGGTGATDAYVRDNVGIPLVAALPRASKILSGLGAKGRVSLIAGGGLRSSSDFAKCLALGADAVYIGTAALIAMNCEQYRICHTGRCPTGVTTQDPILSRMLDVSEGVRKLSNFIRVSTEEVAALTRIVGKDDVAKLGNGDLVALKKELAFLTGIRWLDGKYYR